MPPAQPSVAMDSLASQVSNPNHGVSREKSQGSVCTSKRPGRQIPDRVCKSMMSVFLALGGCLDVSWLVEGPGVPAPPTSSTVVILWRPKGR